jgi:hypothetical protein
VKRFLAIAALAAAACVTPPRRTPVVPSPSPITEAPDPQAELHRAVDAFVTLAEGRRFDALHALLSKPLRDRYTPATLARDFGAEPYAQERVARIKARADATLVVQGEHASLEWAPGRSLRLIREAASWKVAALE